MDGYLDTNSYPYTQPCTRFLTVSSLGNLWTTWRRSSVINDAAPACLNVSFAWFSHCSLPLKIFPGDEPKETNHTRLLPLCERETQYFCFVALVNYCNRSLFNNPGCVSSICSKYPASEIFLKDMLYIPNAHCRDYINTLGTIKHWRGKLRWETSHTLPHADFKDSIYMMWIRHKAARILHTSGSKTILYEEDK